MAGVLGRGLGLLGLGLGLGLGGASARGLELRKQINNQK